MRARVKSEVNTENQGILDHERVRWFRNVNTLGAAALIGAGVATPQHQNILFLGAAINAGEAAAADVVYQRQQKSNH